MIPIERASTAERDEVRFSLRGLLLLMTAVAIVAGVLGASLRGVDSEGRSVVLAIWGISLAIVIGRVGYCAVKRWQLIRIAGRTQHVLPPRGFFGSARSKWMTALIGLFCISLGVYYMVLIAASYRGPGLQVDPTDTGVIPSAFSGLLIAYGTGFVWWRRTVKLCDVGVLYGIRLLRWSHVTKHECGANAIVFAGVDQSHRDVEIAAATSADNVDAVKTFVERKLKSAAPGWTGLQRKLNNGDAAMATPLVPLSVSQNVTWRGLGSAACAFILLVIVSNVLLRPLGGPSREFWHGMLIAFVVMVVKLLYDMWSSPNAGAPLVRLFTRLDWPSAIVTVVVVMGCLYVSRQLVFPSPLIGYSLGFCAGVAACALGGMVMRDKFDLCENGVVLVRWPFLPWARVRVLKWDRDGKGALLLRSSWRRIKARVPMEHRQFVDRVLREKTGERHAKADGAVPPAAGLK
jgi:hypothetical protein